MTEKAPARSRAQRKQDVLDRLAKDEDGWFATASADGEPCLVPLSFVWERNTLLICTRRHNPTAVNLTRRGRAVITVGPTRDVVHIEGTAEALEGDALAPGSADAFAVKTHWDPRADPAYVYFRVTPRSIRAWREANEQAERELMRDGTWLI
jgi:general stress protein 26